MAGMSTVISAASTPSSQSFQYPRAEGSGLGAVGGKRMGDDAQEVRFAGTVHVGEDGDEIIEAEDVQQQHTLSTLELPPRSVIAVHRNVHCPYMSR